MLCAYLLTLQPVEITTEQTIGDKPMDLIVVHFLPKPSKNLSYLSYRKRRFEKKSRPHPKEFMNEIYTLIGKPSYNGGKPFQSKIRPRWYWNIDKSTNEKCRTTITSMVRKHAMSNAYKKFKEYIKLTKLRCTAFQYLEKTVGQKLQKENYDQVLEFEAFAINYPLLVDSVASRRKQ